MKLLLLAALVVSISAANLWQPYAKWNLRGDNPEYPEFKAHKEYVYDYESQVLTSLPTFTKSHGGIKIIAKVKFDFISATDVVMQLTDSQILSLNHEINNPSDLPPVKQLTPDHFTPLPSSQTQLIKPKLELPIKFSYVNGKVTSIDIAEKKETNWSIDLKRSVISMLQIRLQADTASTKRHLSYNELSEENSTAFSTLEPALDGECYSAISVRRINGSTDDGLYKVLKTRDPNNCVKANSMYKYVRPQTIDNCDCDPNLDSSPRECVCKPTAEEYMTSNPGYFKAKTLVKYDITSGNESVLIKRCAQSATYRYEFPNYPDQYLATFSNQSLDNLQQNSRLSIHTNSYTWKRVDQPWRHQILDQQDETPMMSDKQIKDTVQHHLDELEVISNQNSKFGQHIPMFMQLVESLKVCSKDQLRELYNKNNANTAYRKWKLMVDGLAHCNTSVCDEFLMDQIASRDGQLFPYNDATLIFMLWSSNKVPTVPVLKKFRDIVIPAMEKQSSEWQKVAYHHSLLCFGSMVRRYIQDEEMKMKLCVRTDDKLRHAKNIRDARDYEKVIEGRFTNAKDDQMKIVLLKALANLGSLESLVQLQRMMAKTESNAVRVHAIHGVRNLCFQNRHKVLQTITPLLMDVNEDQGVRMAAFIYYLRCNPSTTQLHKLIEWEQDLDLKTVFVQLLKNELRADGPKQVARRQKAKLVLSKVKAFQMSPKSGSAQMQYALRKDTDGVVETFTWLTQQTPAKERTAFVKLDNVVRGISHPSLQLAYRAEGLEMIYPQLSAQSTSRAAPQGKVNPSLTLSIISAGQEMAVVHVDKTTFSRYLVQALRTGEVSIPIKVFQTYISPQEQNQKLQPNGMWLVSESAMTGVIDIEGVLKITKPAGDKKIPDVTFVSQRRLRFEECNAITQFVKCGFAHTGVTSAARNSRVLNNQYWTLHYSIENRNATFNFSNPGKEIVDVELDALTYTFYTPNRLPIAPSNRRRAVQEITSDNTDRLAFHKEVEAFRSVELKCEAQGDVYLPELYKFLGNRLSLMPSIISMKKQHVKLTLSPITSSPRNYTITNALTPIANEVASQIRKPRPTTENPIEVVERDSREESSSLSRLFYSFLPSNDAPSSQQQSEVDKDEQSFGRPCIGSIQYLWQGRVSSISDKTNLTMWAKVVAQYNYDHPSTHFQMDCERPPISGEEQERSVSKLVITKTFNSPLNQMLAHYNFTWGPKSAADKHQIQALDKHTAIYKDSECYEQSAYGCKDQYGVFYPIWYNQTTLFISTNTNLIPTVLRAITPSHMNSADKMLMWPVKSGSWKDNEVNMTRIYRPYSELVDMAYTIDQIYYNMSNVYVPFQHAFNKIWNEMPHYPLYINRPSEQFVPVHRQISPFYNRDSCVVDKSQVFTMESKKVAVPKSDCEVSLLSDCNRQQQGLAVTLKSQISGNTVQSKVVKTKIEQSEIEVQVAASTTYQRTSVSLKINGEEKSLQSQKQFLVTQWQQQQTVAIVECSDDECEIKSSPHGLYVRVNIDRVTVELENGETRSMCGLCSVHPEVSTDRADYQTSVQLFKNNRVQRGGQCSVEERQDDAIRYAQQTTCDRPMKKYKMSNKFTKEDRKELKTCVTTEMYPLCRRNCKDPNPQVHEVPARCVSQEVAQRINLVPSMEGNEMYLDDESLLSRLQSAEIDSIKIPISSRCQQN